ncbi:hypothetical protein KCTC52924_02875 [Arenibacter antarcticus]|uniref:TFIIB-type zinc ribbon-containing protein n=1 Tax=Arenibacter antarcticus TaxID=2040469 RepID=A0ABW5VH25_9FLAO|nr:TFIIB-type zinc ribbon-containing protein [Arenibacter sp. H213]MCM4167292.1 hypothetical protein [Arenibacter sp. H213]
MGKVAYRKCSNCGTVNLDSDYCENCGELININLKRKLAREALEVKKQEEKSAKKPNAVTVFFKKALEHPNLLIKIPAKVFYSIWVVVMSIGAFIAFLFSYIAA